MTSRSEAETIRFDSLAAFAAGKRDAGRRIILTNGCYDLLHPGHLAVLSAAAEMGDTLIVGVNNDQGVRRLKGDGRPVMALADRLAILCAVRWVDAVTAFEGATADRLIEEVRPACYVKGGDYDPRSGGRVLPEADTVARLQIEVAYVPLAPGHASSDLITRSSQTP